MSLKNWSTTAASNNSAAPNGAPEGWALSDINNTMRQVMADVRTLAASNTIASAATCDLGSLDETFLTVSGTTTITALGTVSAGIYKFVTFSGALTLTHNGTSLILPGAANITTVAGDTGLFLSLGSGNWKCVFYQESSHATYQPYDALLSSLAGQTTAANKVQAYSGVDTATLLTTGTASGNIPLVGTSSATELLAGLVELATTSEASAGTDTARAVTAAGVKATITARYFTSTAQTITSAGALTIAHGLGVVPSLVQVWLKCTDAAGEHGYAQNDLVAVNFGTQAGTVSSGVSIVPDATNLNVRFADYTGAFAILNKTTGAPVTATNTKWNMIVHAWNLA